MTTTQVSVNDGKYTIVIGDNGNMHALRYGEPWGRDLAGDNLVYWLAVELDMARRELASLYQEIEFEQNTKDS